MARGAAHEFRRMWCAPRCSITLPPLMLTQKCNMAYVDSMKEAGRHGIQYINTEYMHIFMWNRELVVRWLLLFLLLRGWNYGWIILFFVCVCKYLPSNELWRTTFAIVSLWMYLFTGWQSTSWDREEASWVVESCGVGRIWKYMSEFTAFGSKRYIYIKGLMKDRQTKKTIYIYSLSPSGLSSFDGSLPVAFIR